MKTYVLSITLWRTSDGSFDAMVRRSQPGRNRLYRNISKASIQRLRDNLSKPVRYRQYDGHTVAWKWTA